MILNSAVKVFSYSGSRDIINLKRIFMKTIIVAHTTRSAGPPHALIDHLKSQGAEIIFIDHPLVYDSQRYSQVTHWRGKEQVSHYTFTQWTSSVFLNYFKDFVSTVVFLFKVARQGSFDYYIGCDSLSCLPGLWLRPFFSWRAVIAYNTDYSERRFQSTILEFLYQQADRLVTRGADVIWCITQRIAKVRHDMGRSKEDIIIVSNGVSIEKINTTGTHSEGFVYSGNLEAEKGIDAVIHAINKVPKTDLTIYGSGPAQASLERLSTKHKLTDRIHFAGQKDNLTILESLSRYEGGFALYNAKESYTYYCDPLKVKEYLAAGTPVIMTDVPEIAEVVRKHKAGVVLAHGQVGEDDIAQAMRTLQAEFDTMSSAARKLSIEFSWKKIFDHALTATDHRIKQIC